MDYVIKKPSANENKLKSKIFKEGKEHGDET